MTTRLKRQRCEHAKRYACRVETDERVTAFVIVCASCGWTRSHSHHFLGLWCDWKRQTREKYPRGARFTILVGPASEDARLTKAAVEAIRELAAQQKAVDSSSELCSAGDGR